MAITDIGTCAHVDTLLRFLTPSLNRRGQAPVTIGDAEVAAMALADASYRHLGAGISDAQVHAAWYLDRARLGRLEMSPALTPASDPVGEFLAKVRNELAHARDKFPLSRLTTIALGEEVGELCKAILDEPAGGVTAEAVQVAALAARLVLDGDRSVDDHRARKGLDPIGQTRGG